MKIYVVICYDDEPYVYADYTCHNDAMLSALEAQHETGCRCVVKTINVQG